MEPKATIRLLIADETLIISPRESIQKFLIWTVHSLNGFGGCNYDRKNSMKFFRVRLETEIHEQRIARLLSYVVSFHYQTPFATYYIRHFRLEKVAYVTGCYFQCFSFSIKIT